MFDEQEVLFADEGQLNYFFLGCLSQQTVSFDLREVLSQMVIVDEGQGKG